MAASKGKSPTERTMAALKKDGWKCAIVERWLRHVWRGDGGRGIRKDMFGIIDIIAIAPGRGLMGVQSTGEDYSGHDKKLTGEKALDVIEWLETTFPCPHCGEFVHPVGLQLWAWRKILEKRGGKRRIWAPRVKTYTLADFDPLA